MNPATLEDIVGALASGARIVLSDDGRPELRMPAPHLTDPVWSELCRGDWLEPMANGGTFKLSQTGYLAYTRSVR